MHDTFDEPGDGSQDVAGRNRSESTPLYLNAPDTGSLKLIVGFFTGFSITVTIALIIQIKYGITTQISPHGSVVSDSKLCSDAGVLMLREKGSAVDAVIATAFCMGVFNEHVTGLGSGGYMLVYDQRERKLMSAIDFRVTRSNHSAIGIPGFVAGLALAHELYGVLPWDKLISPAEHFARSGFEVSQTLLKSNWSLVQNGTYNENLASKLRGLVPKEVITNQELAQTLKYIATSGPSEFYKNILAHDLAGIVNIKDIFDYKALNVDGIKETYENYDIITAGAGSGGPLLVKNLKYINRSLPALSSAVLGFEHVAEGWRVSTASHIAAIDNNDVYVTMVSGLGSILGSQILTKSGYILNNQIEVTKDETQRPTVLLTPVIALQSKRICGRRLLLGAGDVRDVVQALVYLLRNESGNVAAEIEAPRVRILTPNIATDPYRKLSTKDTNILREHKLNVTEIQIVSLFPSINVIEKVNDNITAYADKRGGGDHVTF